MTLDLESSEVALSATDVALAYKSTRRLCVTYGISTTIMQTSVCFFDIGAVKLYPTRDFPARNA